MTKITDIHLGYFLSHPYFKDTDIVHFIERNNNVVLSDESKTQGMQIAHLLWELEEKQQKEIYTPKIFELESKLLRVLGHMEQVGVYIDAEKLTSIGKQIQSEFKTLEKTIKTETNSNYNLNSSKQIQKLLFEDLGIKPIKKTKTGYSVDEEVLAKLAEEHDVAKHLLQYRHLKKLDSTYVQGLLKTINPRTKRIHSTFSQTTTTTGRLASTDPNLQNIPFGDEHSDAIKACFTPAEDDYIYTVADYSQVELRILAYISGDTKLIEAFNKGEDIHAITAKHIFQKDDISKKERSMAKSVNFGVVYGITGFGLAKMIGTTTKEADTFIENFFKAYPKVQEYIKGTIEFARENGYVKTLFDRRRYIPKINDANSMMRAGAEREAINMPIQGTSADIIKYAMIELDNYLQDKESRMIIQVHDELVFEIHKQEEKEVLAKIQEIMENIVNWNLKLTVDINTWANWLEAK